MAVVREYHPNSISFPESFGLDREFYRNRSHLPGVKKLEERDKENYESYTVFHDVFFHCKSRKLTAIGPPCLNFIDEIKNLKIYSENEGENILKRVIIKERDRICFFQFEISENFLPDNISLTFEFPCGYISTVKLISFTLEPVFIQVTTLQLNNKINWIIDWIRYMYKLGVQRIILYDNGSKNYNELISAIRQLKEKLEIVFVSWPFNYGPMRSRYNKFCQAGQNNHSVQFFGNTIWNGHFDVDEYPAFTGKKNLADYLRSQWWFVGVVRIAGFWVPFCEKAVEPNKQDSLSIRDFYYREIKEHKKGRKYFIKATAYKESKTHNGIVKFGYIRRYIPVKIFAFYHYIGLTTNWNVNVDRQKVIEFNEEQHVIDRRIVEFLDN